MLSEIKQLSDENNRFYGKLVCWQNPSWSDPFWHYGIGLSDTHVFDTGAALRPFKRPQDTHIVDDDKQFHPWCVIRRLQEAVTIFVDWRYHFLNWNCEHLARLVATGKPRSYQVKPIWFITACTPNGDHPTAKQAYPAEDRP